MKKTLLFFFLGFLFWAPAFADEKSDLSFADSNTENKWIAPPPVDESDRLVKFLLQADYQYDYTLPGQAFSMFDLSAKRQLDEN